MTTAPPFSASLSILFLELYNQDGFETIGLDDAASRLGVERRRIYDIVNVLESVGVLARKAKNRYSWKGFGEVPKALEELREEGLRKNGNDYARVFDDDEDENNPTPITSSQHEKTNPSSLTRFSMASKTDNKKEKSLGLLTQNFVKLFLCADVRDDCNDPPHQASPQTHQRSSHTSHDFECSP